MKKKRIEKRNMKFKNLEEDQARVQSIMNNDAFNENPFDILLQHVSNTIESSANVKS